MTSEPGAVMDAVQREQIDGLFSAWDHAEGPGGAVGIYREGELIHARGYGAANLESAVPITPATVFHVASLSKQFTAVLVGLLAREGHFSLDDDIRRYLPELPKGPPITFRHIIHHTSGLRDQWDLLRLAGWRAADLKTTGDILWLATRQQALNFPTGTRYQYINTGYTLMAIAVERITGRSLQAQAEAHLFAPLGMQHTCFQDDHQKLVRNRALAYSREAGGPWKLNLPAYETIGPTGLLSTVEDFARWERNFLSPTVGDADFIRQLSRPGTFDDGRPLGYGFGLILGQYRGLPVAEHAGGDAGFASYFLRFPEQRLAVAIFCNAAELRPGPLTRRIADILLADHFKEAPSVDLHAPSWAGRAAGASDAAADAFEAMTGLYRDTWSGTTLGVEDRGGRLFLVPSTGGTYELLPAGPGCWRFPDVEAQCQFTPAREDAPARMQVTHAGQTTALCERVEVAPKRPESLAEYAGTYRSDDLGVHYTLAVSGASLVLRREKFAEARVQFTSEDDGATRSGDGLHLRFVRDSRGHISGLLVSAERAWNIHFVRA
ncbi:penicillin-binding protein [Myxococcus hansupus]|uniref:Penicillin-binding protein n=1 Tax=Pseudomyxococcus hansupus TaxID=1297742 RepID=A0A0H4X978_9BACT|nr:serine hydrolase domain-containing protein [Myxococcus hansupus]AKQ64432.1 penicillin-binding protein [Myxococcus hansupus]